MSKNEPLLTEGDKIFMLLVIVIVAFIMLVVMAI